MNESSPRPSTLKSLFTRFLQNTADDDPSVSAAPSVTPPPAVSAAQSTTLAVPRATYDAMADEIGAEAVEEIAKVFVRDTETRLKMFESTALDSARDTIQREAHSLKSAAGTFGLFELADAARELENNAHELDATGYRTLTGRLRSLFDQARTVGAGTDQLILLTTG
ncbi:Hpt domain-containing protein [Rhodopseudomonas faecalis]|uniref:Hpt domain-containing protein n=2 Tax=Rhodopseudomonas faecalis TaxID=99655 RepID=A0A318TF08_9BRAD|nr:Hpt domain-containing protein [Rhodopseudomonas faecalis]TAH66745.1 MAG: Hpt domain-containing protein [Rhodopseudomonas palustris]